MPSAADAAEMMEGIADLLDVLGERFKPDAYRRAARSLESMTEDLSAVAARNELRQIPGVGEAIEEKLREYLATGRIEYYERLRREVPPGIVELLGVPGLGPKTARRFWTELGVEGPAELVAAIDGGRLSGVKGFGPKKVAQIRAAVEARQPVGAPRRISIDAAYPVALRLVRALRESPGAESVEIAGSFRRGRETVGDLDILVTSTDPPKAFDAFSKFPEIREVRLRGPTKETVVLANGLQVDMRVVEPAAFGAALQYFTGSKDHNVALRSLARDRGLRVNEYGVFRGEERIAGRTEEEVYGSLGLAWIPPELRESHGEIEAARKGPLPPVVGLGDLHGDLHVHLASGATAKEIDRIRTRAKSFGLAYLAIVVRERSGEGGWTDASAAVRGAFAKRSAGETLLLPAVEGTREDFADSKPDARVLRILRPAEGAAVPKEADAAVPRAVVVAHFAPAPGRSPDVTRGWLRYAARSRLAVEVGPGPERLDSGWARAAREAGARLHLPTGVGGAEEDPTREVAVAFARRAATPASEVVNTAASPP